ncbi:MAG: class I SAM-dependent methyltransferase [Myxococcota bacterium]|nr:class I SAM-dependent methyltransferase [Myxococcota bacterium]
MWADLAERLGLRLATPRACPGAGGVPLVELRFQRLDPAARMAPRLAGGADVTEKYGAGSEFARISKLEDPGFLLDFTDALARAKLPARPRLLDLGVNRGDELALLQARLPGATCVGIDHSATALAEARRRCPTAQLIEADLARLAELALGTFDLIVSIGTLQSAGLDDRALLRQLVQHHLAPAGAVIFGFPNCRYIDGEVEHGTRMKNFTQPELGLLIKDLAFYRKYLQQHGRQVFVTGKHYVLVTGVAIT